MKILAISAFYPPDHSGGYGLRLEEIFDGLSHRGHKVSILTNRANEKPENESDDKTNIFRSLHLKNATVNVFRQIYSDCKDLFFLNRILKQIQPDIIYLGHIQNLSNTILPYFSKRNYPLVFDEGGSGIIYLHRMCQRGIYFYKNENDSALKKLMKGLVYKFTNVVSLGLITPKWPWPENMRIFYNSQSGLHNALDQGAPVEDAEVIYSGLDLVKFPYQERQKIEAPVKILMPTRIKEPKGCLDGVKLIRELKKRNISAELQIIGEVQSEAYYSLMMDTIQELGLADFVKIDGMISQSELSQRYHNSDITFFPSYFKTGFSRVPLEAMASGCLVITYGNEGTKEVVQNSKNGIIAEEGDIIGLADSIQALIVDPDGYKKIVQAARKEVESRFSLENYLDHIESLLYEDFRES